MTPYRLARVERAEAAVRAALADLPLRHLRVRDLGDRASVEIDAALLPLRPGRWRPRWWTPYVAPASPRPASTPAGSGPAR